MNLVKELIHSIEAPEEETIKPITIRAPLNFSGHLAALSEMSGDSQNSIGIAIFSAGLQQIENELSEESLKKYHQHTIDYIRQWRKRQEAK